MNNPSLDLTKYFIDNYDFVNNSLYQEVTIDAEDTDLPTPIFLSVN